MSKFFSGFLILCNFSTFPDTYKISYPSFLQIFRSFSSKSSQIRYNFLENLRRCRFFHTSFTKISIFSYPCAQGVDFIKVNTKISLFSYPSVQDVDFRNVEKRAQCEEQTRRLGRQIGQKGYRLPSKIFHDSTNYRKIYGLEKKGEMLSGNIDGKFSIREQ